MLPQVITKNESNFAEIVQFNRLNVSAACPSSSFCRDNCHESLWPQVLTSEVFDRHFVFIAQFTQGHPRTTLTNYSTMAQN